MPNLSDPLKSDNNLIFVPETRISLVLEGERRCLELLSAHRPDAVFIYGVIYSLGHGGVQSLGGWSRG